MHDIAHHFNFLALLVSAVFIWLLGAAWYSPALFAKPWMAALGIKMGSGNKSSLLIGMISSLVGDLILAFMLDHFVIWINADTLHKGAFIGFIAWLGFIAAPAFPQGIYEGRPFKLFAINTGYWLVALPVVGALLAVWR